MVFKSMKRAAVIKALRRSGCSVLRDTGGHTVYRCPCGSHAAPVPRHRRVSGGVVRSIGELMQCLPRGWLQ